MSAKIISSLKDENPMMQKQLGCMNGIFELFNRHHFLTGRRLSSSHHKKLLPGAHQSAVVTSGRQEAVDRDEEHRASTESSRISSSSSFSSSMHYDWTDQAERTLSGWHSVTETSPQATPVRYPNSSRALGYQSVDLRDVVKDAMSRQGRGLSIKTTGREEGRPFVMNYVDSPRPLQTHKSTQQRVKGGDRSAQAFSKRQEAPKVSREGKESVFQQRPKEPSRFSYDGREWQDAAKSSVKHKELPRLSLDSRDSRRPGELRSSRVHRVPNGEIGDCREFLDLKHEPSRNKHSCVVAKLMGLETFPDLVSTKQSGTKFPDEEFISKSSKTAEGSQQHQIPMPSQVPDKDDTSPQSCRSNSVTKPTSCSRFPLEQAPWKPKGTTRDPHNLAAEHGVAPRSAPHASSTIYGEIEKRITDLEFKRSGKDLRALKQILEAMQKTKQNIEKQMATADLEPQTSRCSLDYSSSAQESKSLMWRTQQNNCTARESKGKIPPKKTESSIIIIKQDNQMSMNQRQTKRNLQEPGWDFLSVENQRGRRTSKAAHITKDMKHAPAKSSATKNPRSQQRQQGVDNQKQPTTTSSDSHKARMQSNKVHMEAGSPNRRFKLKSTNLQRYDDRLSEPSREIITCYHQDDTASMQSESNNSFGSQMGTDISSTAPSEKVSKQQGECRDKDPALRLNKGTPDLAITTTEQPSPVSVLDATFYGDSDGDDSPSPVKKITTAFTDDESLGADGAEWSLESLDDLQKLRNLNLGLERNNRKMEDIRNLVHKLKLLNPAPNESFTDCFGPACDISNPNHGYITKILLASGLLNDVSSVSTPSQLHSYGHVINPNLFHVLEQTEGRDKLVREEVDGNTIYNQKVHRKILFDTVNEILLHRLSSESPFWKPRRTMRGQELLKQLHSEVDHLQTMSNFSLDLDDEDDQLVGILNADMAHTLEDWTDYSGDMPAMVLDIERLIFKDLIGEVINDGIVNHQNRPRRHCRQLFTN